MGKKVNRIEFIDLDGEMLHKIDRPSIEEIVVCAGAESITMEEGDHPGAYNVMDVGVRIKNSGIVLCLEIMNDAPVQSRGPK